MRQGRAKPIVAFALLLGGLPAGSPAAPPRLDPPARERACGVDTSGPLVLAPDPGTVEKWIQERRIAAGGQIPVYFHVIHDGIEGNVPDAALRAQVEALNRSYAGLDLEGNLVPGAANTGYAFVLAGIDRRRDAAWFRMTPSSTAEIAAKSALSIDARGALNIYVCKPGEGLLGWATLPWQPQANTRQDGVVVHYATLPQGDLGPFGFGGTTTHEVGHYLGLYHTFQGGCHPDANCATAGDLVCDTPAEAIATAGCPGIKDTCSKSAGPDPIHNYMDYSADACYEAFTRGQDLRMKAMMSRYRPWIGANLPALPGGRTGSPVPTPTPAPAPGLRVSPNPFNPTTSIEYSLPRSGRVSLRVFDVAGRTVAKLVEAELSAGDHRAIFEGRTLPSGVYVAVLEADGHRTTQRLILLK